MIGGNSISGLLTGASIRAFQQNAAGLAKSSERLATGQRINRASDDPAGLVTSENLRAVLAFLDAETRSTQRSDQVIATADSALGEVSDMVRRAEALEVANANGAGLSDVERAANQMEIDQIHESVNRALGSSSFNGQTLFDGSHKVSASGGESVSVEALSLGALGDTSEERIQTLRDFRTKINTTRGELGAFSKNVIGAQTNNIATVIENLSSAKSMIRDADYAKETARSARFGVLTRASLKALSFLKSSAGNDVLRLLG